MSRTAFMPNSFALSNLFPPASVQRTWVFTFLGLIPLLTLLWRGQLNIIAALIVFLSFIVASALDKNAAILLTFAYLFLIGDLRRIIGTLVGFPKLDPLLVVGPIFSAVLAIPLLLRLRLTDAISKGVFALMVVMALEIFNPRQGPVTVGISGALFYLGPLLWFWIGRRYGTDVLIFNVLYRVLYPVGVLAAVLGICQTYIGFLPWEKAWIANVAGHYHALNLGGGFIRSFGFSSSSVEYSNLLLVGGAFTLAAFFAGKRYYIVLFPIIASSLFLASSRSAIVKLLFAAAVAWAFSSRGGKAWAIRLPLCLAIGICVLGLGLSKANNGDSGGGGKSAAQYSTQHQLQGLSHPFDKKYSTAGLHSKYIVQAIVQGFRYPLGNGLGSTTLGLTRLGGDSAGEDTGLNASEVDFSDAFISMGVFGGLTYSVLIFLILRQSIAFARYAPKQIGLPVIGILAAMGGAWIALGQYALAPLIWFLIGGICRLPEPSKAEIDTREATVSILI